MDGSNQKSKKELWIRRLNTLRPYGINKGDQQRESSFLSQGMLQLMWNVLFMWFYVSWALLPYVLVKHTRFGVYPFRCKFYVLCIHSVYGHGGVDSKDKLFYVLKISFILFLTLCLRVLFTFHIYSNTTSYQVAAGQITWARKGHDLLFVNFTFLCHFFFK